MTEGNFVDYVKIYVSSGKGGKGSSHLHREKFIEKGGPDGGDGGRGGHVYIKGNKNLWTLFHLKFLKHMRAGHGGDGGSSRSTGHDGEDKFIEVPLGTVVKDQETGDVLFEITEHDEVKILAEGGKGGLGNWNFRSSTNQTPRYAQPGMPVKEVDVTLESISRCRFSRFSKCRKINIIICVNFSQTKNCRLSVYHFKA
jgi:GTP-binding protein